MSYWERDDESVDDVISEFQEPVAEEQVAAVNDMSEALFRMEQANLYRSLLEHSFFGPNSATHHIQAAVESELRTFVTERFKVLLGMAPVVAPAQFKSPFTEEEVEALKLLAGRITKKPETITPIQKVPQINRAPVPRPVSSPVPSPVVSLAPRPTNPTSASSVAKKPQGRPAKKAAETENENPEPKRHRQYRPKNNPHEAPPPSYNERLTQAYRQGSGSMSNNSVESVGAGGGMAMPAANLAGIVAQYATGSEVADQ